MVGDVVEEAAQLTPLTRFIAASHAQQLVHVRQPSLGPAQREHVLGITALRERTLNQLGERPSPRGSALGPKACAEPHEPVTVDRRQADGILSNKRKRLPYAAPVRLRGTPQQREPVAGDADQRRGERAV